jgi:ligand-binding sensor domain-containing protein
VGTEDEGIFTVPLESRATRMVWQAAQHVSGSVEAIHEFEGERYAVTASSVYRFDADRGWREVMTAAAAALSARNVAALGFSSGALWVGYFDAGLDVLRPDFSRSAHYEDDALFCINRIVADASRNRTAVATANGLVLFDGAGRKRQVLGRKDGLLSDHVTDVAFREGGMVLATPAGLSFVDRGGVRSLYVFQGLVNNHVYSIGVAGDETVAGTLGGVSVLDKDAILANYTTANSGLRHNWVTAVARVEEDWFIGTYGAGVLRLGRDGRWSSFADLKRDFVVNPNAMLAGKGRVYAGSLGQGLFVYDRDSKRWTNVTDGLPSLNVSALAESGGSLYVGTDNGLVRMSEEALP